MNEKLDITPAAEEEQPKVVQAETEAVGSNPEQAQKIGNFVADNEERLSQNAREDEDLPNEAAPSPKAVSLDVNELDRRANQEKSVTVTATNPYDGTMIFGKGATEEEARADANRQINEYRDSR